MQTVTLYRPVGIKELELTMVKLKIRATRNEVYSIIEYLSSEDNELVSIGIKLAESEGYVYCKNFAETILTEVFMLCLHNKYDPKQIEWAKELIERFSLNPDDYYD